MSDAEMAGRLRSLQKLVPEYEAALSSLKESHAKFRVLQTVHPPKDVTSKSPHHPKTLFILDSSFNPPSIAHRNLAKSVLEKTSAERYPGPHGLLLLFSTMNADKAPSAASFPQRLAMMTVFAHDLLDKLCQDSEKNYAAVPISVGVTTAPYYTDKSKAIETDGLEDYPDKPKHIHLLGFDTLTRFFAAKYYKDFDPPLSALEPFFDSGHQLRVTLRPDADYGSAEDQRAFVKKLEDGEMERDGAKREWSKQVALVPPNPQTGVSSTNIRKAAKAADWETVRQLCTPGVAEWLKSQKLYEEDDRGAKMA